jgi:hypothetical protein
MVVLYITFLGHFYDIMSTATIKREKAHVLYGLARQPGLLAKIRARVRSSYPHEMDMASTTSTTSHKSIPVMILVGGRRWGYFMRVLSSVVEFNRADNRSVFLVGENASDCLPVMRGGGSSQHNKNIVFEMMDNRTGIARTQERDGGAKVILHVLDIKIVTSSGKDAVDLSGPMRLKHIWYAAMHAVWDSWQLRDYNGDIVFLEDDVVPSPDFFFALEFACAAKAKRANLFQLVAMGGWGGENQFNPDARTFTMKASASFPTMGYAFDRGLWREIDRVRHDVLHDWEKTDWAESLGKVLCKHAIDRHFPVELASFHRCGHLKVIQPTLSRVWHVGVVSQVGSVHESSGYKWPVRPAWDLVLLRGEGGGALMRNSSDGVVLTGMRDVFGFESPDWSMAVPHASTLFPASSRHDIVSSTGGAS